MNCFSTIISTASFVATLPMQAKPPTGPDSLTDITKTNIQIIETVSNLLYDDKTV